MPGPVSVVVPARNEASTIGRVVTTLSEMDGVAEVIVVDNGSEDDTRAVAKAAGARTVFEPVPGMGHAVRAGYAAARHDWVMKIDADLDKFDTRLFARMLEARAPGVGLVKGAWHDPNDNMPMTRLLVMPAIKALAPELSKLRAPNSGIYLFDRSRIAYQELTGGYAVDLDVMLRMHAAGAGIEEVDIGLIQHDPRDLQHYNAMADTIMEHFMLVRDRRLTLETVIFAQRAEQVIVHAIGVLAVRARAGAVVTVYLAEPRSVAADVLNVALAGFPTARVRPLTDEPDFLPRGPSRNLNIIAPFPTANEGDAIRAALRTHEATDPDLSPEVLLMPLGPGSGGAVDNFRADTALDVSNGLEIKEKALSVLGLPDRMARDREAFQTFNSLPDVLKAGLCPDTGRSIVGNL